MSQLKFEGIPINFNSVKLKDILVKKTGVKCYPYLITEKETNTKLIAPSPLHGRSIIVDFDEETKRYTITKGNDFALSRTRVACF